MNFKKNFKNSPQIDFLGQVPPLESLHIPLGRIPWKVVMYLTLKTA